MKHRRPPLPASMTAKPTRGVCRWCGLACEPRRWWHDRCLQEYFIATRSTNQRAAVFARDKGVCAACGLDTLKLAIARNPDFHLHLSCGQYMGEFWQADHITALVNAGRDLAMWGLGNLQTLCTACHRAKTRRDCAVRRACA